MENVTINKEVGIGDTGLPFDVSIEVSFHKTLNNVIVVHHWMEDNSPYDNPPESWFERMKKVISEYFYELDEHCTVTFQ